VGYERIIDFTIRGARPQFDLGTEPFHEYRFDDGTVWTEFHRSGKNYLLRFPGLADFAVSAEGTEVVAHPTPDCDATTLEHLYINQLVPLALSRQGQPAFHASVVTVAGGAVAFLGKTGMGKSTLAASFALNGAAFLTDDALLVEETASGCEALPSHASVRLWEDSVAALAGNTVAKAGPVSYSSKARLLAGEGLAHSTEPQRLLAAFELLDQAEADVSIRTLSGLDRYMAWLANSFLLDIEDHDLLARHFEWTHRISARVPTFALDYPRDYGMLGEVREAVRQHLENPETLHET
jgi:hypothetical protein